MLESTECGIRNMWLHCIKESVAMLHFAFVSNVTLFRSLRITTHLGFGIFRFPRPDGDTPVVSDTLVACCEHSPSPMGPNKAGRQ